MAEFDTSEEEDEFEGDPPPDPLRIDWLNVPELGLVDSLALSALPGCRFREHRRNLNQDLEDISSLGITDVFILMEEGEFTKYRVPGLLTAYENRGIFPHHYSVQDGNLPTPRTLMLMISSLRSLLYEKGNRVLIHCYGGLGRTCLLAAALMLSLDPDLLPADAINLLRNLRGARAVQTVRQWNFLQDYRLHEQEFSQEKVLEDRSRSVSR